MKEFTCIVCPKGCQLKVVDQEKRLIEGASCQRGIDFAIKELVQPMRTLQTTVQTCFDVMPRLPVKTDGLIPLENISQVMDVCHQCLVECKVVVGQIIIEDICDTGVNIVATSDLFLRLGDKEHCAS